MGKAVLKPKTITFIKWDGTNVNKVLEFMKWMNTDHDNKHGLYIYTLSGRKQIEHGDYIIRQKNGDVDIMDSEDFYNTYNII